MGSKYIRKHLMPSLMATLFLFLSACQGTSQDVQGRVAKAGKTDGDGKVEGRVKEDAELQKVRRQAETFEKYLLAAAPALSSLKTEQISWENLLRIKYWYMGDESTSNKFNGLLSMTRFKDSNEILAHQTQYEVFINSLLFAKLDSAAQNSAVLEEYLIALFSLKHLEDKKLCDLVMEVYKVTECAKHAEGARTLSAEDTKLEVETDIENTDLESNTSTDDKTQAKASGPRNKMLKAISLEAADMVDIKAVAAYLQTLQAGAVSIQDVIIKLKSHNFDTRIFDYKLGKAVEKSTTSTQQAITVEEFNLMISQMENEAKKEMNCSFHESEDAPQKCTLSIESLTDEKQAAKMLSLKIEAGGKKFAEDTIVINPKLTSYRYGKYTDPVSKVSFLVIQANGASLPIEKQKESSEYRGYYLLGKITSGTVQFVGLYSAPGIVTKVDATKNESKCEGAPHFSTYKPGIFVSTISNSLDKSFVKIMNPVPPCY